MKNAFALLPLLVLPLVGAFAGSARSEEPAKAEEMYSPEVFGRSEGGILQVAAQRQLATQP